MSKKPTIVTVLGPDRVGKSTIVNALKSELEFSDLKVSVLHFSGPQPHHNSPIDQYIQPLDAELSKDSRLSAPASDVILCDRGFSEVCYYERVRRNLEISEEWAWSAESYFESKAEKVLVYLVEKSWEWAKPHHIKEIMEEFPGCSPYYLNMRLRAREKEHHTYYEYMHNYLDNMSLLPYTIISESSEAPSMDIYHSIMSV